MSCVSIEYQRIFAWKETKMSSKTTRLMATLLAEGRAVRKTPRISQSASSAERAKYYSTVFAPHHQSHTKTPDVILPANAIKALSGVRALEITASVYAQFLNAMSTIEQVKAKLFELGLWGKIKPATLIHKYSNVFQINGGLTRRRSECMFATLYTGGRPPNDTTALEYLTSKVAKPRLFDILGLTEPKAKEKDMTKLPQNAFPIVLREFQDRLAREQERFAAIRAAETLSIQST